MVALCNNSLVSHIHTHTYVSNLEILIFILIDVVFEKPMLHHNHDHADGNWNWMLRHNSLVQTHNPGTQCYSAPEMIRAQAGKVYGCEADVWSLGITLIELAAMKFPYDCGGGGEFVMVMAITTGDSPVAPAEYGPNFGTFVALCLTQLPAGRPLYSKASPDGRAPPLRAHQYYLEAKKLGLINAAMLEWKRTLD